MDAHGHGKVVTTRRRLLVWTSILLGALLPHADLLAQPVGAGRFADLAVGPDGGVFASTGAGSVLRRDEEGLWHFDTQPLRTTNRQQPELAIGLSGTVYMSSWGGQYSLRRGGTWMDSRAIEPVSSSHQVGFVEIAAGSESAYVAWAGP